MRSKFQSLLLVVLVFVSLSITKGTKTEISAVNQPVSFAESLAVSSLAPEGQSGVSAEESFPQNLPKLNYGSSPDFLGNLVVNIPRGFLSGNSVSYQLPASNETLANKRQQSPDVILKTKIALVSDLDNDNDLISYNSDTPWSLASITKLMTAVLAIEEIGNKEIIPSENALNIEGNLGKLEAGKLYKVDDLIKIMMLTSSNHAAIALADFYLFGQAEFVNLMNKKAVELGMNRTVFRDPTGLSPLNQSTANDIRKLIKYIVNNHPEILAWSRDKSFGDFQNINRFVERLDFLGGKTGTIDESKQNLVSLFLVDNRRILIIVLGADDRFVQTQQLLDYLKNAQ
ncbi:MAG: serine hydrolase [bacterium]|nr:serine hydrolase [bacterium]